MVDTINELAGLSRKLNQKSDTLNEVIESINVKLSKLNIGIEVWLEYDPIEAGDPFFHQADDDNRFPMREAVLLGYCKFPSSPYSPPGSADSNWQLAAKDVTLIDAPNDFGERVEHIQSSSNVTPLLKKSRAIRAGAMRLIPGLLDNLKIQAEKLLRSIEDAEKTAKNL